MFREFRLGGLFFLCAMAGLLVGGCIGAGITGHAAKADQMAGPAAIGAVGGAIAGSLAWVAYRYTKLPPKG